MSETHRDRPPGETSGSSQRPARRLMAPVLAFDLAREDVTLKQEVSWQRGDRNARTLIEDPASASSSPSSRVAHRCGSTGRQVG